MSEKTFTEEQQAKIRAYYAEKRGDVKPFNLAGEETALFDIFAAVPRPGALNAIERMMTDLAEVMEMEMAQMSGLGITIVG